MALYDFLSYDEPWTRQIMNGADQREQQRQQEEARRLQQERDAAEQVRQQAVARQSNLLTQGLRPAAEAPQSFPFTHRSAIEDYTSQLPEFAQGEFGRALRQSNLTSQEVSALPSPVRPFNPLGFIEPAVSPESIANVVRRAPLIGPTIAEEAGRVLSPLTSPVGVASSAFFPGLTAAGAAGAFALGRGGQALEEAGVNPRLNLGPLTIGPRGAGELIGSLATPALLTAPGRTALRALRPSIDTEAAMQGGRVGAETLGATFPDQVTAGLAKKKPPLESTRISPNAPTEGRGIIPPESTGGLARNPALAAPEPLPGVAGVHPPEPAANLPGVNRGNLAGGVEAAPRGELRAARLSSVADDAERAALAGEPPPPKTPSVASVGPAPIGRTPPYPLPSTLHTVDEIAQDVRRSTQNFAGATARVAGKLPPVRVAIELTNPSALVDTPPAGLVKELGMERAQKLQSQLIAHARKADQGSAISSAVEEAVDQEARRVGFTVKDGVLSADGRELAPVGDVFENPSRFALTPPQRQLVDDVHAVLQDMNLAEKAAGVAKGEIFSGEGRYFPRRVVGVRGVENMRAEVRRMTGVKQGFQKGRFYTEMAAGLDNGVDYGGSVGSLVGTRIRAGVKAVSDTELAQLVRPLGRTIKTGAGGIQVGEMGTMVPAFGGRAFPRETSIRIMEGLNPRPPASVIGAADQVNNLVRPLVANGDLSATTLQLLPTLTRNPVAWGKAVAYSLDSLVLDGRMYGRYVQANARELERYIAAGGIWNGSEFTFDAAAKGRLLSTLLKRGPLGRTNNAFNSAINVAALENFKGMVGVGDSMGSTFLRRAGQIAFGNIAGETSDEIAASIASKMTGRMSTKALGVQAQQRAVESAVTFAPKYYRAAFGLLGDAVQGGMRGAEARRVLGSLAAGSLLTYVGVAKALGQDLNLDPSKSTFMTVKIGGANVGVGGPFYGIVRLVASSATAPEKLGSLDMSNPAYRWLRGRLSPIAALVTDLAKQSSYMGKPLNTPKEILEHVATGILPFTAQSAIEEGPGTLASQALGMREFPTSAVERRDVRSQELTGKDYFDPAMSLQEQQQLRNDPQIQDLSKQIDESQRQRGDEQQLATDKYQAQVAPIRTSQEADDAAYKAGTMDVKVWKDATSTREIQRAQVAQDLLGERTPTDTTDPTRLALLNYYAVKPVRNPDTGETDWETFFNQREQALADLSPEDRATVQIELEKNLTPVQREFRDASATLRTQPSKYVTASGSPVPVDEAKQIDDFGAAIGPQMAKWAEKLDLPNLDAKTTAKALAKQMGDLTLYDWYIALNKDHDKYVNPDYTRFMAENRSTLQPFYPYYYDSKAELQRWGIVPEEVPLGRPTRPQRTSAPTRPTTLERAKQTLSDNEYNIIIGALTH